MANYLCKTCREKARLRKQEKENKQIDPEKIKSVTIKIVGLSPLIVSNVEGFLKRRQLYC